MITLLAPLLIASLFLLISGDAPEFDQPVSQELIDNVLRLCTVILTD